MVRPPPRAFDGAPPTDVDGAAGEGPVPAGEFSAWLDEFQAALGGGRGADVPCGGCTACCASRQFVHVAPDESDTLAHIPDQWLVAAPGMPDGHVLLGYDEQGRCPMLTADGCSIYEHRPRTCRTYDCRVFAATGVEVDADQALLAQRVRRWRFSHPTAADVELHDAVRSAALLVAGDSSHPGDGRVSAIPAAIAVRAIEVAVRQSVSRRKGA